MQTKKKTPAVVHHPRGLRERAEELARAKRADVSTMSAEDVQALVHELQVHQIELDMQNEELRRVQVELAEARDRYVDLYEFAPAGYLSLDGNQTIRAGQSHRGRHAGLGAG